MRVAVISLCVLLSGIGASGAMVTETTVNRVLDICDAITVAEASAKGHELGWQRMADSDMEEWRRSFVAYNGGSVDVVGWRREQADGEETFSFWIAEGPNGHKACIYSTRDAAGVLDALSQRLGEPQNLERYDEAEMVSAWWVEGEREYSFTQTGSSAMIAVGPSH